MMNRTLLFAGRPEYQQQLHNLRTQIRPLKKELNLDRKLEKSGDHLQKMDEKELALRAQLKESPNSSLLKARLTAVRVAGMALAGKSLLQGFLVYGGNMDGKEAIRKEAQGGKVAEEYRRKTQQYGEQKQQLEETVRALRAETDPAKEQWLKEFEKTNGSLNKVEKFVLSSWEITA